MGYPSLQRARVHLLHQLPQFVLRTHIFLSEISPAQRALSVLSDDRNLMEAILAENVAADSQDDRFVEYVQTNRTAVIFLHRFFFSWVDTLHTNL